MDGGGATGRESVDAACRQGRIGSSKAQVDAVEERTTSGACRAYHRGDAGATPGATPGSPGRVLAPGGQCCGREPLIDPTLCTACHGRCCRVNPGRRRGCVPALLGARYVVGPEILGAWPGDHAPGLRPYRVPPSA